MQFLLTTKAIDAAIRASEAGPDKVLPDSKTRGAGRLLLRAHRGSGLWQFRYAPASGLDDKHAMGHYAKSAGKGGLTLADARAETVALSALLRDPATRNLRAHFARVEQAHHAAEQAGREAIEATERARVEAGQHTLGALLGIYVDHLRAQGKASAPDVAQKIERHIVRGRPALAARPAREVERREIAAMVRSIKETAPRVAELLRSYVSAAYRLAIGAEGDPGAPVALIAFRIERSPADGIKSTPAGTRDRTLTGDELRLALGRMVASRSMCAKLLYACVYAGGQRLQQMARARVTDFNAAEGSLLLWDGKGRRKEPRAHLLPLGLEGQRHIAELAHRAGKLGSEYLFSVDGPKPVKLASISVWASELNDDMLKAGEVSTQFQAKDLRRTAETSSRRWRSTRARSMAKASAITPTPNSCAKAARSRISTRRLTR